MRAREVPTVVPRDGELLSDALVRVANGNQPIYDDDVRAELLARARRIRPPLTRSAAFGDLNDAGLVPAYFHAQPCRCDRCDPRTLNGKAQ